jgi:hypothetical protein
LNLTTDNLKVINGQKKTYTKFNLTYTVIYIPYYRIFLNVVILVQTLPSIFGKSLKLTLKFDSEFDRPAATALRRAIVEVKQRWSVIGRVTKNILSQAPPCFGRHVKPLVPAAFAVVSTDQSALDPRGGLWPVFLMHKVGLWTLGTL